MATNPRANVVKVAYRFQRVYADLQTGHALTVKASREEPVRPFMSQSDLDGACGVHLVAMIVSIYGLAKPSALHEMGRRKFGLAAEIFSAYKHTYFTGVHAAEWVELFNGLQLPFQLTAKFDAEDNADGHAVEWLMRALDDNTVVRGRKVLTAAPDTSQPKRQSQPPVEGGSGGYTTGL